MIITVLGSLLGMITITAHLNWKFRYRWDTLGFLPWYVTKLVAAPVLSLAALGLMSQVEIAQDVSATGIETLGIRGASPIVILSVAILTGLFSNRIFDWLRDRAGGGSATTSRGTSEPPAAEQPATQGGAT